MQKPTQQVDAPHATDPIFRPAPSGHVGGAIAREVKAICRNSRSHVVRRQERSLYGASQPATPLDILTDEIQMEDSFGPLLRGLVSLLASPTAADLDSTKNTAPQEVLRSQHLGWNLVPTQHRLPFASCTYVSTTPA